MRARASIGAASVAAVVAATLLVAAGTANAHDTSGHSDAHGKTLINSFEWHVSRDGDGRPDGYFKTKGTPPTDVLVMLAGPATCVDFEGNRVGFLYPIEDHSRPFILKGQYILITGEDNGGHGRDKLGFVGPAPRGFFQGCRPGLAPLSVDGHIAVDDD
jgi:hypothetical protein